MNRSLDAYLLRLLAKTLDVPSLLAEHPEVSREDLRRALQEAARRLEGPFGNPVHWKGAKWVVALLVTYFEEIKKNLPPKELTQQVKMAQERALKDLGIQRSREGTGERTEKYSAFLVFWGLARRCFYCGISADEIPEGSVESVEDLIEARIRVKEDRRAGGRSSPSVQKAIESKRRGSAPKQMEAFLYIDGASRGNPGPAGAGAVLLDGQGRVLGETSESLGETTNNEAEYRALLLGLSLARTRGIKRLRLRSDSELLARQLQGRYRVRHPRLKVLFEEAKGLIGSFEAFHVESVLRGGNKRADLLANQAVEEGLRRAATTPLER